jgi:hypothetical protein
MALKSIPYKNIGALIEDFLDNDEDESTQRLILSLRGAKKRVSAPSAPMVSPLFYGRIADLSG